MKIEIKILDDENEFNEIKNKFTKAIAQKELLEQQLENQIERKKNLVVRFQNSEKARAIVKWVCEKKCLKFFLMKKNKV